MNKSMTEIRLSDDLSAFHEQILSLHRKGESEQALSACQQALSLYPHSPLPHHLLACLLEKADPLQARRHLCAALCLDPAYAPAAWNLKALQDGRPLRLDLNTGFPDCEGELIYDGRQAARLFRIPIDLLFLYGHAKPEKERLIRSDDLSGSVEQSTSGQTSLPAVQNPSFLIRPLANGLPDSSEDEDLSLPELVQCIARQIRSIDISLSGMQQSTERIACGSLVLDCDQHCAFIQGERIHLTPMEFELMKCLSEHPNENVSSETLILRLYGQHYGSNTQSLRTLIVGLRKKFGAIKGQSDRIVTVPGFGYRLSDA